MCSLYLAMVATVIPLTPFMCMDSNKSLHVFTVRDLMYALLTYFIGNNNYTMGRTERSFMLGLVEGRLS